MALEDLTQSGPHRRGGLTAAYAGWVRNISSDGGLSGKAGARSFVDWNISYNAVPEPGTWALMIGGFGLAGALLRRRRAVTG